MDETDTQPTDESKDEDEVNVEHPVVVPIPSGVRNGQYRPVGRNRPFHVTVEQAVNIMKSIQLQLAVQAGNENASGG